MRADCLGLEMALILRRRKETWACMSPTVLRVRGYRFYFFSREEMRPHVHVQHATGEAKIWLDPKVELAHNWGMTASGVAVAIQLVKKHEQEIRAAWAAHFGR